MKCYTHDREACGYPDCKPRGEGIHARAARLERELTDARDLVDVLNRTIAALKEERRPTCECAG